MKVKKRKHGQRMRKWGLWFLRTSSQKASYIITKWVTEEVTVYHTSDGGVESRHSDDGLSAVPSRSGSSSLWVDRDSDEPSNE
ncbi:hypothetical protein HAX54_005776 [Datura stramonium]|uniref:Uncharacterized protein n=1 Tax=Datura stramonium TaxID=4076 RepID=A0ABS8TAK5_DATST|nr:hypothetical protein [Datura stramonium]